MPVPIILPKFGFTLETAEIVKWLKREGDNVRSGDPICEVTTDKVNMEVEAPEAGTLFGLLYKEGDTVPVTEVICYLLRPGEAKPDHLPAKQGLAIPEAKQGDEDVSPLVVSPVAQRVAEATNVDLSQIKGSGPNNRITRRDVESAIAQPTDKVRATPAARHQARQNGIDLHTVIGTGPRGRIQREDVQKADETDTQKRIPTGDGVGTPFLASTSDAPRVVKLAGMRKTIATRLQKSFQTAPHIFLDAHIDMTAIESLREKLKARNEKLSVTAIVVKACASVLLRHPWLNATLNDEDITLWPTANIGVAVALDEGLIVPVVHHAQRLNMRDIHVSIDDLANRARSNNLKVDDMVDGTFTISNLGMYGVDRFTAIINPPQVAILAVGRTQQHFVPDANDQPVLKSVMSITLSADHRVVDGTRAALFLQDLRTVLEEPALLAW